MFEFYLCLYYIADVCSVQQNYYNLWIMCKLSDCDIFLSFCQFLTTNSTSIERASLSFHILIFCRHVISVLYCTWFFVLQLLYDDVRFLKINLIWWKLLKLIMPLIFGCPLNIRIENWKLLFSFFTLSHEATVVRIVFTELHRHGNLV